MGSPIVPNHITKLICLTFRFGVLGLVQSLCNQLYLRLDKSSMATVVLLLKLLTISVHYELYQMFITKVCGTPCGFSTFIWAVSPEHNFRLGEKLRGVIHVRGE